MTLSDRPSTKFDVTEESVVPNRFWWLKRIACAAVLFLFGLAAVHWSWIQHAKRRHESMQQLVNHTMTELNVDQLLSASPENKFAIDLILDAANRINVPEDIREFMDRSTGIPISPSHSVGPKSQAEFVERNEWILDLVRRVRLGKLSPADQLPEMPPENEFIKTLAESRRSSSFRSYPLTYLMSAGAMHPFTTGDDREWLERLLDLNYLRILGAKMGAAGAADAFQVFHPLDNMATTLIRYCGPAVILEDTETPDDWTGTPATREQILQLIDMLFHNDAAWLTVRADWANDLKADIKKPPPKTNVPWLAFKYGLITKYSTKWSLTKPSPLNDFVNFVIKPKLQHDQLRRIQTDLAEFRKLYEFKPLPGEMQFQYVTELPDRGVLRHAVSFWFRNTPPQRTGRYMPTYSTTNQRLAAVALASDLYRRDHGELPESTEELVPAYLPELPIDPFDPEERPIRLTRYDRFPYSIGGNGIDDDGKMKFDWNRKVNKPDDISFPWSTDPSQWKRGIITETPRRTGLAERFRRLLSSRKTKDKDAADD